MIPMHIKKGATALERSLLNQEKYQLALRIRDYRGIALMQATEESIVKHWELVYYAKVANLVGFESDIITQHITDDSDFDRDWESLQEWMDDGVDYTAYHEKMKRRDAYLNALTVSAIHKMGYTSNAHLYTRTIHGRWGWDDQQEEVWRFPDGDEYRESDGKGYAVKLGILDKL